MSQQLSNTLELVLASEVDTKALAQRLAKANIKGSVWLSGDLGAGKTTLTRYWLQALGHKGSVKSPTYTLVEPYELPDYPVYHADLYRLQDPEELSFIGFEEYLEDENALIIIEWASRANEYLPEPVMTIDIQMDKDSDNNSKNNSDNNSKNNSDNKNENNDIRRLTIRDNAKFL